MSTPPLISSLLAVEAGQVVYYEIEEKHTYKTYEGYNHNPCSYHALPDVCMENWSTDKPGYKRPYFFLGPIPITFTMRHRPRLNRTTYSHYLLSNPKYLLRYFPLTLWLKISYQNHRFAYSGDLFDKWSVLSIPKNRWSQDKICTNYNPFTSPRINMSKPILSHYLWEFTVVCRKPWQRYNKEG